MSTNKSAPQDPRKNTQQQATQRPSPQQGSSQQQSPQQGQNIQQKRSKQQQQADSGRGNDNLRNERSLADREVEEARRDASNSTMPGRRPEGWTARDS